MNPDKKYYETIQKIHYPISNVPGTYVLSSNRTKLSKNHKDSRYYFNNLIDELFELRNPIQLECLGIQVF